MSRIRLFPGETTRVYSFIGLQLIDDFTGDAPIGRVKALLDIRDGNTWRPTGIAPVLTASGALVYPKLGRVPNPAAQPDQRFRVRVEAEFYRPRYTAPAEGFEFVVRPHNDSNPPASVPLGMTKEILFPAANYPFPAEVPVLRGRVVALGPGGLKLPVPGTRVSEDGRQTVLTDDRGEYALPVRWKKPGVAFPVDAAHPPTGRTGTVSVTLPGDIERSRDITIA